MWKEVSVSKCFKSERQLDWKFETKVDKYIYKIGKTKMESYSVPYQPRETMQTSAKINSYYRPSLGFPGWVADYSYSL